MELELLPRKLVIPSIIGANAALANWLNQNDFSTIQDGDGLRWELKVTVEKKIKAPLSKDDLPWEIAFQLQANVTTEEFIKTGTLLEDKDSRLISLIRGEEIPLRMKPISYRVKTEDEAKRVLAEVLPSLKETMNKNSVKSVKRSLIGRFVNSKCRFNCP